MTNKINVFIDSDEWYPVHTLYRTEKEFEGTFKLDEKIVLEIEELQKQFEDLQDRLGDLINNKGE
jgi:hypothetical protein